MASKKVQIKTHKYTLIHVWKTFFKHEFNALPLPFQQPWEKA